MSNPTPEPVNLHDQVRAIGEHTYTLAEVQHQLVRELSRLRWLEERLFDPDGRLPEREEFLRRAGKWHDSMSKGEGTPQ